MKAWAAAIGGGIAFLAAMVLLASFVFMPIVRDQETDSVSDSAGRNLARMLAAEHAFARRHSGAFAEFRVAPGEVDDPAWNDLGIAGEVGEIKHEYRARMHDGKLWIVARGDLDGDPSVDDWEIDSESGMPRQVFDDVREIYMAVAYYKELGREVKQPNADISWAERAYIRKVLLAGTAGLPVQ